MKRDSIRKKINIYEKALIGVVLLLLILFAWTMYSKPEDPNVANANASTEKAKKEKEQNDLHPIHSENIPFTMPRWSLGTILSISSNTKKAALLVEGEKINAGLGQKLNIAWKQNEPKNQAVIANERKQAAGSDNNKDAEQTAEQKIVYLTFDDGPFANSTEILKLLQNYNADATFFMLAPNIKKYPDAVKQMVDDGHAVGMHGVTHDVKQIYQSPQTVVDEMLAGQSEIEAITGVKTNLIRVPYGSKPHMKDHYLDAVNQAGFKLWDWNLDSLDWKYRNEEYVNKVIHDQEAAQKDGLVILLHEKETTLAHLEQLLKYYSENGYEMKKITESMPPVQF